jgi:acyl-coenzyme A thioesterase PaaI-like protein
MNVRYLAGSAEGTLRAEAVVRQRGRTITLTDVAITDETGRLIVSASCSYYCVERQ